MVDFLIVALGVLVGFLCCIVYLVSHVLWRK